MFRGSKIEGLLVSTSYGGGRIPDNSVVVVSDFLLLHGNGVTEPRHIGEMIDQTRALPSYQPKPILFNEDDHYEFGDEANNFAEALLHYTSWGYFDPGDAAGRNVAFGNYKDGYQIVPVEWGINTPRKRTFFDYLKELTSA